jgi:phospho-N-acetylmuramoyl-pentapeptide-transferase
MGGVLILIVVAVIYLGLGEVGRPGIIGLIALLGCGLLGFVDDYAKVVHERSLGLKPKAKIAGQAAVAFAVGVLAVNWAHVSPAVTLPWGGSIDLGILSTTVEIGTIAVVLPWLYIFLVFFMVISFSNTVNLTDGLDGLAAGTVMIVMLVFAAVAFQQDNLELAVFSAAVAGACLGFLWYNSFPADIFMGDTGSLGLGAAIATLAVVTKTELFAPLIGGIYVAEGLSVLLQVASFKLTGKRIFRMAPLHHHFEMAGWSETKVMVRFWIVTGIMAGAGFALWIVTAAGR